MESNSKTPDSNPKLNISHTLHTKFKFTNLIKERKKRKKKITNYTNWKTPIWEKKKKTYWKKKDHEAKKRKRSKPSMLAEMKENGWSKQSRSRVNSTTTSPSITTTQATPLELTHQQPQIHTNIPQIPKTLAQKSKRRRLIRGEKGREKSENSKVENCWDCVFLFNFFRLLIFLGIVWLKEERVKRVKRE